MEAPRESDLVSSEDASNVASGSGSGGKEEISSFVDKKVGGRGRKIRRKARMMNAYLLGNFSSDLFTLEYFKTDTVFENIKYTLYHVTLYIHKISDV